MKTLLQNSPLLIHPHANQRLSLGEVSLAYLLERKRRKTVAIYVRNEGVLVRAPLRTPQKWVDQFLVEKQSWVLAQLLRLTEKEQTRKRYCWEEGAPYLYLGRVIQLKVLEGTCSYAVLDQERSYLQVSLSGFKALSKDKRSEKIAQQVERWQRQAALDFYLERIQHFQEVLGVKPKKVGLTQARTRWGSASSKGGIRLHWRLLELPAELLDYVIVHELAHLIEMNHSQRFWNIVQQVLPDYKARRHRLRAVELWER